MISEYLFSFLILVLFQFNAKSQSLLANICDDSSNYTSRNFENNLNLLLFTLTINTPKTGFSNHSQGVSPDKVYGLALCKGKISTKNCTSCLQIASRDLPNLCPYCKGGTAWYNNCMVRYGNKDFFSKLNNSLKVNLYTDYNVSNPAQLEQRLVVMIESISTIAAFNKSSQYYATGVINLDGSMHVYGMVQCTRDLSPDQCFGCLNASLGDLVNCCYGNYGAWSLRQSCVLWYSVDPIFNSGPTWVAPPKPNLALPAPVSELRNGHKTASIALGVGLPLALLAAVTIFLFICFKRRNRFSKNRIPANVKSRNSLLFKFSMLQQATENFSDSNKLGEGGFGPVYKGKMQNGQEIAVKRLARGSDQGLSELENEVQYLAELQHRNLVRLFGVCMEKKEMLLVYEYIRNKSLDTLIFENSSGRKLKWEERLRIIKGISRGLLYLHQDSAIRLVHRDLKASNILLDENMNPKISDFGLARLLGGDHTQSKTSKVVGTYGYMAPEYAVHGTVSTKADIFSFGVLILEITAGRSNSSFSGTNEGNILNYAWEHWTNGTATEMIDPCLDHGPSTDLEAVRCINIALLCAQQRPNERPNIYSVNLMLTRNRMQIPPPSNPAFVFGDSSVEDRDLETSYNSTTTSSVKYSINEVSCTVPYPR